MSRPASPKHTVAERVPVALPSMNIRMIWEDDDLKIRILFLDLFPVRLFVFIIGFLRDMNTDEDVLHKRISSKLGISLPLFLDL